VPVGSSGAWFSDLYQIWYKSELEARGLQSPAAKSVHKIGGHHDVHAGRRTQESLSLLCL